MNLDLNKTKENLLALKDEYQNRINKIEEHFLNPQDELNEHWDDQAISTRDNDMRKHLLIEAKEGLMNVNNALLRLDNGTYGECAECGEDIEEKRLQAIPYATLCMQHAK